MQNKYLKFLIVALALAVIVPQIALAAWWNPVSWGLWGRIWSVVQKPIQSSAQWDGEYSFIEINPAGPPAGVAQTWVYDLTISNKGETMTLDVNGFQVGMKINATGQKKGDSLNVIFESLGGNGTDPGYKKGDILLTLTLKGKKLAIEWIKMQPNLESSKTNSFFEKQQSVVCTMDAKQCPDGSYVGREGPKCEFKACPEAKKDDKKDETAGWKTYTNSEYGFGFKYPNDWEFIESNISEGAKNDLKMALWLNGLPKGKTYLFEESTEYPIIITAYNKAFNYSQYPAGGNNPKIINGLNFVEFDIKGITYPDSHFFVLDLKNKYIQITDNTKITDAKLTDTFNKILSTFKFTK